MRSVETKSVLWRYTSVKSFLISAKWSKTKMFRVERIRAKCSSKFGQSSTGGKLRPDGLLHRFGFVCLQNKQRTKRQQRTMKQKTNKRTNTRKGVSEAKNSTVLHFNSFIYSSSSLSGFTQFGKNLHDTFVGHWGIIFAQSRRLPNHGIHSIF